MRSWVGCIVEGKGVSPLWEMARTTPTTPEMVRYRVLCVRLCSRPSSCLWYLGSALQLEPYNCIVTIIALHKSSAISFAVCSEAGDRF